MNDEAAHFPTLAVTRLSSCRGTSHSSTKRSRYCSTRALPPSGHRQAWTRSDERIRSRPPSLAVAGHHPTMPQRDRGGHPAPLLNEVLLNLEASIAHGVDQQDWEARCAEEPSDEHDHRLLAEPNSGNDDQHGKYHQQAREQPRLPLLGVEPRSWPATPLLREPPRTANHCSWLRRSVITPWTRRVPRSQARMARAVTCPHNRPRSAWLPPIRAGS
jgi:hypothetical protein